MDFYLYEALRVSCLTAGTFMDQHGIQGIEQCFSSRFRHVCAKVQIFRVPHNLNRDQQDSKIIPTAFRNQTEKTLSPNTGEA